MEEKDEILLDLVAEKVESLCGHKPTEDQVWNFLKSIERKKSPEVGHRGTEKLEAVSKSRGPRLNFKDLDVPIGEVLDSIKTGDKAEVVDEKSGVRFRGKKMSLMEATREIPGLDAKAKPSIRPASHWKYKDRLLEEIYNEVHRADN